MSHRFYFGGSDDSNSDDESALPYPKPLARNAFLAPNFNPTEFLSSLRNRHQTLEDLRAELRTRSQELNKELLDLVNDNYQDFLGLGASLDGGEEKVEEIRLGLLSFGREIEGLKNKVEGRRVEMGALIEQKRVTGLQIRKGKALLEVDTRLKELERRLKIGQSTIGAVDEPASSDTEDETEEEDEQDGMNALPISRLQRRVQQYMYVRRLMSKVGLDHPFITRQLDRAEVIRQTILLDLSGALGQAKSTASQSGNARQLGILTIYGNMGEQSEALQVLKGK